MAIRSSEKLFCAENKDIEENDFFFDCVERLENVFTLLPTAQKLEKRIKKILDDLNSLDEKSLKEGTKS